MDPEPISHPTAADRWCNYWAWACTGFGLGFGACVALVESGHNASGIKFIFEAIVPVAVLLGGGLPRAILEMTRQIRKHRELEKPRNFDPSKARQ